MTTEDVYALPKSGSIADFGNEIFAFKLMFFKGEEGIKNVDLDEIRAHLTGEPVQTFEQRYLMPGGHYYHPGKPHGYQKLWREIVAECPARVARINECVGIINQCKTRVLLGRAMNEIIRLLYGKDHKLLFSGARYHPDKLGI